MTSWSSEEGRPVTPPPFTAGAPACALRWSRRKRWAVPACTVGCIPAKELLETAAVYRTVKGAKEYGIGVDGWTVDFSATQARKRKVIDQQHKGLQGLLKRCKVTTFAGDGQPGTPGRVCGSRGRTAGSPSSRHPP